MRYYLDKMCTKAPFLQKLGLQYDFMQSVLVFMIQFRKQMVTNLLKQMTGFPCA